LNKLEIGIGNSRKKNGFISSDLSFKTDFPYDLRLGLPFPNESIDLIYSEHVLEHFSYDDLIFLLKDCYRVLKPKGIFSLAIPNAKLYIDAYFNSEKFHFQEKYCRYKEFKLSYRSRLDYVNYIFYMDGHHRYMFDEESILIILTDIGFNNVRLRDFEPNLDKEERKYQSIYAEGIKEKS
jgi:predicted SAM-dependent methyltransferase